MKTLTHNSFNSDAMMHERVYESVDALACRASEGYNVKPLFYISDMWAVVAPLAGSWGKIYTRSRACHTKWKYRAGLAFGTLQPHTNHNFRVYCSKRAHESV